MSKSKFIEIDEKEAKRIDELDTEFENRKDVSLATLFDSELIPKIVKKEPRIFQDCPDQLNLPINCLLYERVYCTIYTNCDSALDPQLIKPYLERGLLLPILASPLSSYKTAFSELITNYPYVSCYTFDLLRFYEDMDYDAEGGLCEQHLENEKNLIYHDLSLQVKDKKQFKKLKSRLEYYFFPKLEPVFGVEAQTIYNLHNEIKKNQLKAIEPLMQRAELLQQLRNSQVFKAIPQTNGDYLTDTQSQIEKLNCRGILELEKEFITKDWIANTLGINYNYKMPVEQYLDYIIPRKKKINNLLNDIAKNQSGNSIKSIKDEIWKINNEIENSKAIETWTFLVNLTQKNWKVVLGLIIGSLIGSNSGNGCSVDPNEIKNKIPEKSALKIPDYPKKTVEWLKEKLEDPSEKIIAKMLSQELKTIQVWNIRKRLSQEK